MVDGSMSIITIILALVFFFLFAFLLSYNNNNNNNSLDVTVISPLQKLTIRGAATSQGNALEVGEERKRSSHSSSCYAAGISFDPLLVVETSEVGAVKQWRHIRPLVVSKARGWGCRHLISAVGH